MGSLLQYDLRLRYTNCTSLGHFMPRHQWQPCVEVWFLQSVSHSLKCNISGTLKRDFFNFATKCQPGHKTEGHCDLAEHALAQNLKVHMVIMINSPQMSNRIKWWWIGDTLGSPPWNCGEYFDFLCCRLEDVSKPSTF